MYSTNQGFIIQKAFFKATRDNNIFFIKEYISDKDITNDVLNSSFIEAARYGSFTVLQYLVEKHNIDVTFNHNEALTEALNNSEENDKFFDIVKYLVEHGADLNDCIDEINYIAECGNLKLIKYLVEHGATHPDWSGAIIYMCKKGDSRLCRYLIEKNTCINIYQVFRNAIYFSNLEMMKLCVNKDQNLIHTLITDKKPHIIGSKCVNVNVVKYLLERGVPIYKLIIFSLNPTVAIYLSEVYNVKVKCNLDRWNVLMRAFHSKKSKKKNIKNDPLFDPSISFIVAQFVW